MEIALRVRRFIIENFYVTEPETMSDAASLLTLGVVDSTGVLEVICFLEAEFGIKIEDEDATPANLESIERIAAFVARKRDAAAAAPLRVAS